jgi:hypothetical protein
MRNPAVARSACSDPIQREANRAWRGLDAAPCGYIRHCPPGGGRDALRVAASALTFGRGKGSSARRLLRGHSRGCRDER